MNRLVSILLSYILFLVLVGCSLSPSLHKPPDSHKTEIEPTEPMPQYPETHVSKTEPKEHIDMLNPEQIISAEVLLVSATGIKIDDNTLITSENIENYRPAAGTIQKVSQYFQHNGFEVTPLVGISLTIYASARHFSEFFNISLIADKASGIKAVLDSNTTSSELPLNSIEGSIKDLIITVTFVPPPDFGPTNFSLY